MLYNNYFYITVVISSFSLLLRDMIFEIDI